MRLAQRLGPAMLLALMGGIVSGCPSAPVLEVNPRALDFGTASVLNFRVTNTGGGTLNWTLTEVTRAAANAPWVETDIPWLSATPTAGTTAREIDRVTLTANRSALPVGTFNNVGVRVRAASGSEIVVPLSIVIAPTLTVNPAVIALAPEATQAAFNVANLGTAAANWSVLFLPNPDNLASATSLPEDIVAEPNPGTTAGGGSTPVTLRWAAGRTDFSLLVSSTAGNSVVRIRFGATLEGLQVTPNILRLFIEDTQFPAGTVPPEQPASTLRIANVSAVNQSWQISLRATVDTGAPVPISTNPGNGTTQPGRESTIAVRVTDPTRVLIGAGNYTLSLNSGDAFVLIPIVVEVQSLPIIAISEPPDPEVARPEVVPLSTLDFGREDILKDFYVANVGPRTSRLHFRITHDDQGKENPLLLDVSPLQGDTNGPDGVFFFPPGANTRIDAEQIRVTVDRSAMTQDVEFRNITVEALDPDFTGVIDAVEKAVLRVRVERPPLKIEGAINRSRPPYLLRFVFLMRDTQGRVIPTKTRQDLSRLTFNVTEDGQPLDLNETNLFLRGPAGLKTNLIVFLDFSGSMLNAGTTNTAAPLQRGEALAQVRAATKKFIDDLPEGYRVQLMYHYDRQQPDYIIHTFSTDRESLKTALDAFSLPPALSGTSAIRDALLQGITDLAAEDSVSTLPFDDADVRAIVFITDGRDNSSLTSASDLSTAAQDNHVRLYPLIYAAGSPVNLADMVVLAEESGGHLYNAGDVRNLALLLASERGLDLSPSPIAGTNLAFFRITNTSNAPLTWSVTPDASVPWIAEVSPATGTTLPGATATVTVRINPTTETPNSSRSGDLFVTSNNGDGRATIHFDLGASNAIAQNIAVELFDPPGRVWNELQNQLVMTYVTPAQEGGTYNVRVTYAVNETNTITGSFEKDAVFAGGNVRAGQLSLSTTGILTDAREANPALATRAEVFLRTDYVPRNVTRFRTRFFLKAPADVPPATAALLNAAALQVELAPGGLLNPEDPFAPTWRLIYEGDGIYTVLTEADNDLLYGSFGNLLKLTITNINQYVAAFAGSPRQPEFLVEMRADNDIYLVPPAPGQPSQSKFFLYPGGITNPLKALSVGPYPDLAPPASEIALLINPPIALDDPNAFDRDADGLPDFNDPFPDDKDRPGPLAIPSPYEIAANQTEAVFTVRNNRLDTFTWQIDAARLPSWVSSVTVGTSGNPPQTVLAPGQSELLRIGVNRAGLGDGFYRDSIFLLTDVFGEEEIQLALVVALP